MKDWTNLVADLDLIQPYNFTAGRTDRIRYIVVHHNAGTFTAQQIYNIWLTRQASAHYQVDVNGVVSQHVNDRDTAWHAGDAAANAASVGIEHANSAGILGPLSAATLDNGAHLVAALCKFYGLGRPQWKVNVFPHQHFYATACPGPLAGEQRDAYMARAQQWYDAMVDGTSAVINQEDDMPVPADLWNYKDPQTGWSMLDLLRGANIAAWGAKAGTDKLDVGALTVKVAEAIKADPTLPGGGDADAIAAKVVEVLGRQLAVKETVK